VCAQCDCFGGIGGGCFAGLGFGSIFHEGQVSVDMPCTMKACVQKGRDIKQSGSSSKSNASGVFAGAVCSFLSSLLLLLLVRLRSIIVSHARVLPLYHISLFSHHSVHSLYACIACLPQLSYSCSLERDLVCFVYVLYSKMLVFFLC
jgi:hypothetical protein